MIISNLQISGFRGIKEKLNFFFPAGFVILCGRNGSGKSTICDAIEFALTGNIRSSLRHTEKRESIFDYLWWKGKESPAEKYVQITISNNRGEELVINRNENGLSNVTDNDISRFLCDLSNSPENYLEQLCRTMIFRDEEITKLSFDLTEAERFEFTKNSIGNVNFREFEEKAENVKKLIMSQIDKIEYNYSDIRNQIMGLTYEISDIKAKPTQNLNVKNAIEAIQNIIHQDSISSFQILDLGNKKLAEYRRNLDGLSRLEKNFLELEMIEDRYNSKIFLENKDSLENKKRNYEFELIAVKSKLDEININIEKLQIENPKLALFAELYEFGKKLGIQDGHCPLCNSLIDENEFDKHLQEIFEIVNKNTAKISEYISVRNELNIRLNEIHLRLSNVRNELNIIEKSEFDLNEKLNKVYADALMYGYDAPTDKKSFIAGLDNYLNNIKNSILILEQSLSTLEVSNSYDKLVGFEEQLMFAQKKSDEIVDTKKKYEDILTKVENSIATMKRLSGEIVDEHLSELHPLLGELYIRFKPHIDWKEIKTILRGDVRKFLSLQVGEGNNPNFMFSSGQRRCVGIAFLLALHLSRPWCKLNTLIFDDPVQHIDDFRALHLTEILSSIRKTKKQLICTVEDSDLANLMCRRFRSKENEEGLFVNLEYIPLKGVNIQSVRNIPSFAQQVLLAS